MRPSQLSVFTFDHRQYKTFLHTQTTQGARDQQKQTGFVWYQNPPCSLHSRKNVCAGSKTELSSQQSNCHKKHMNLNLFTLSVAHTQREISSNRLFIILQGVFQSSPNLCAVNFTVKKLVTFVRSLHTLETVNSHFFLPQ